MPFPTDWKNWSFYGNYLVSPNGDRFTPNQLMAVFFYRQYDGIRKMVNHPEFVTYVEKIDFLAKTKEIELIGSPVSEYLNMTLALPFPK